MLKSYLWRGVEWQFEEGKQPEGAVELKPTKKAAEPLKNKAVKPTNKTKAVKGK